MKQVDVYKRQIGVPVSYIKEGIKRFKGVEHRIEYVDTVTVSYTHLKL